MYSTRSGGNLPGWFVFLIGVAAVFGAFYLVNNFYAFLQVGGLSISEATAISQGEASATAVQQVTAVAALPTRRPSATTRPPCREFQVTAASAIVRQLPSTNAPLLVSLPQESIVCVLDEIDGGDGFIWYLLDQDPLTRFIELGYMREDVLEAVNPTPTPSETALPAPSITATASATVTATNATSAPRVITLEADSAPSVTPPPFTATPTALRIEL